MNRDIQLMVFEINEEKKVKGNYMSFVRNIISWKYDAIKRICTESILNYTNK